MNVSLDNEELRIMAEQTKKILDEFVLAGFTRPEAMELIKTILSSKVRAER